MSTATAPERSQTPYAEPDEYIDYQLRKTQASIKQTDMLTAAAVAITVMVGYVLLFVLSDHWLFDGGVGGTARVLMFLPVIGFVGWLLGAKVIWPAFKTVSGLYAARTLEASSTEFRSSLMNLVDLKQSGREVSPVILATIEKRAAVTLTKLNVDDAIDKRPLLRTLYVLFGIVVAFCLYSVLSPKPLGSSVLRAIVPFTDIAPATQTEIVSVVVTVGDKQMRAEEEVQLRAGGMLPVRAQVRGAIPSEVTLLFTTADRRFVDEPMQLGVTTDPNTFEGTLGHDEHGLLQSFTYRVVAGDARSPEYRVEIITPPSATVTEVRYEYPEYTELDPRTQRGGAIEVWERTAVTITAVANVPVKTADFEVAEIEDFSSLYRPGIVKKSEDGRKLTIRWTANAHPDNGKFPKFYRISLKDAEGNPDPKPTVYPINVRLDQPPQVVLVDPTTNLEMPANGTVPLVVMARDQDFKLRTVILKIAREADDVTDETLFDGSQQVVSLKHDFSLEPLRLKEGDSIRIWVEAQDNKLPTHNLAKTVPIEITIKKPLTKEEAKKQLEEQKKEQQKRIEEANKKNNEQPNEPNGQQQPDEKAKANNDPMLAVRLFDEETNQPIDVNQYAREMGFRAGEPMFRGYVASDFKAEFWRVSAMGSQDGACRPLVAPRQKLGIRQELRQQLTVEVLDAGILHALPAFGDCRLAPQPADPGRVLQGRVNSALYREKPISNGHETKYVVYSAKPDRNNALPFPLATLEMDLAARDQEFYCQLPNALIDLRKFARQAALNPDGSLPDQVEIAKRLLASLAQAKFRYKDPEPGLPRIDDLEEFLLVGRDGDCKTFNSALALMLREFKIPSRMILGFKGGKVENGEFVVRGMGHAWVEAYLNGHWLILDATPTGGSGNGEQQPSEGDDPQHNPPNENQPQPDNKNPRDQNDGADKKNQKDGQNDKNEAGEKKPGKQSLKNDGSQDQQALEKIAQRAKKNGDLQKKNEQQSSTPPEKQEPQDNSAKDPSDQPMPAEEKLGDKAGEKPGDKAGEKPGDKAGEKPGDKAGEKPGDKAGEKPGDKAGEKPGDKAGEKPGDKAGEKPGDKAGEKPGDKAGEKPGDKAGEKPGDKAGEKPGDKAGEKPGDKAGEKPGDKAGEKPVDKAGEKPGDKAGEKPGDKASEKPGDKAGEKPGDKAGEKPGDKAGEKPGDKAGEKPGDKAGEKPGDKAGEKPGDKAGEKPGDKAGEKPGDKAGEKPGDKPGEKPGDKPGEKPGDKAGEKPGDKAGDKPGDKGGKKPGEPGKKPGGGGSKPGNGGGSNQIGDPNAPKTSTSSSSSSGEPEEANEEFNKEAANLVLKRLKKNLERGEVDQELLDDLGWTPEQLEKFVDRMQKELEAKPDDASPQEKARQRQFEEMLKNLNLSEKTQRRDDTNKEKQGGEGIGSVRRPPPPEYRELFESYTKGLSKKKAAEPPKK